MGGQWLDTTDTFPSSYCCLCTLLHPGSSSSSNLGSFRLCTVLRQGLCVSSTLDLARHQSSSIKRSKMEFIHLAKEHGDGSKYSYEGKKCEWVAVFLEESCPKKCVNRNFVFSWNIDFLKIYGYLYKQRFIVCRKMVKIYLYSCAKSLQRCSKEKQDFCRQNLLVHHLF